MFGGFMQREYHTTTTHPHGLEEERQWVRILAGGDPVKGMLLVIVQKMCTAFHEFEPAWLEGALKESELPFFRQRLANRIQRVLVTLENNRLADLPGADELIRLEQRARSAESMAVLAEMAEAVHAANHVICDALEKLG
jgi:hypothetical protein